MISSVAFRLTLMYSFICTVSLLTVLVVSYLALKSTLQRRLDQELVSELEEYGSLLKTQSIEVLRDVLDREADSEGTDQIFFRLFDRTGEQIVATDMTAWDDVKVNRPHLLAAAEGTTAFDTHLHRNRIHAVRILYGRVGPNWVMQLGESTAANAEILQHFRRVFGIGTLALVGCSMLVGGVMARQALSGVRRVTHAARNVAAGGWDSRVPLSNRHDEIDELAVAFNEMVERIQILIRELKDVTDDIAHDLRTPITRMRMAAESALSRVRNPGYDEEVAGHVLEECDQLLDLINTMLEISQTEAGARPLDRERTDICVIAEDVCELFRSAAEDKNVTLRFSGQIGLWVDGDVKRLKRAIAHILDNAIKYTGPSGTITVECSRRDNSATVSVRDAGVGIPEKDLEKVFARFYRVDKSRAQGGSGLGLSLSRTILRAHGGDVTLKSELDQGSTFTITLPLAAQ